MYLKYENNLYIQRNDNLFCIGMNQQADKQACVTVGYVSKFPVPQTFAEKIMAKGKQCEPPWRGRS